MSRYPTIASLLRPEQLPAYRAATWLVSSAPGDRRSGRTAVLALAHLRELATGRSSQLWDHSSPPGKLTIIKDMVRSFASKMGMNVDISADGILRGMQPAEAGLSLKHSLFISDEAKADFVAMLVSVRSAYQAGATKEQIMNAVERAVDEETVDWVHGL